MPKNMDVVVVFYETIKTGVKTLHGIYANKDLAEAAAQKYMSGILGPPLIQWNRCDPEDWGNGVREWTFGPGSGRDSKYATPLDISTQQYRIWLEYQEVQGVQVVE